MTFFAILLAIVALAVLLVWLLEQFLYKAFRHFSFDNEAGTTEELDK